MITAAVEATVVATSYLPRMTQRLIAEPHHHHHHHLMAGRTDIVTPAAITQAAAFH
jgi:hypothetical protein